MYMHTTLPVRRAVHTHYVTDREGCVPGFELRIYSHRLWVYCVAIEHAVMLMRVVLRR